jgi:hypothetical protein
MPAMPLTALIVPYILSGLRKITFRILAPLCMIVIVVNSVFATPSTELMRYNRVKPRIPYGGFVENTMPQFNDGSCRFDRKPELPVFIMDAYIPNEFGFDNQYRLRNIVILFNDNQKYTISKNTRPEYSHFFLLNDFSRTPKNYKVLDRFNCGNFTGYELEINK